MEPTDYMQRGRTLRRGKTLIRPERFQAPAPMLDGAKERKPLDPWVIFSRVVTFWAPGAILKRVGLPAKDMQQAWREKFALCFIIACIMAVVVFITLFLPIVFCPVSSQENTNKTYAVAALPGAVAQQGYWNIFGLIFTSADPKYPGGFPENNGSDVVPNISRYFKRPEANPQSCQNARSLGYQVTMNNPCGDDQNQSKCNWEYNNVQFMSDKYNLQNSVNGVSGIRAGFDWNGVHRNSTVIDGIVYDFTQYLEMYPTPTGDELDAAIRDISRGGIDGTKTFFRNANFRQTIPCLQAWYKVGEVTKVTPGCFGVSLFNTVALIVILGIICIRFIMAFVFHWFISANLSRRPKASTQKAIAAPKSPWGATGQPKQISQDPNELFGLMLVTCYSEGEASMRCTLDSLANTDYSDDKKLLFIVADGIITGSGNDKSTPDICISMMEMDPAFENPEPQSYIAVAAGTKQHNMAQVYCGYYNYKEHRVPTLLIVKCGGPEEQGKPKPGNRGKRDSQLILMNFFSRVIYNERMTPLDYDMFRKIQHLMGVTPDYFETVLMVDADTKVYPDSLKLLTYCLINDPLIMGLCGETRIANKRQSWVTGIQVFEYYISHHLGKGFESVFGGVTCLPGCFCMYRLKAPKGDNDWVPIITKPEIVQEYSQNVVETLHQKNLLLLGEDRFLTTLMLRNFPNRKMVFCPQAVCKTVVPDEFSVLLSQRRRWINSTIHNLLELVLVRNLCGTFCFSMQFVIFMELIGTVVLPVAIIMTFVLIATIAQGTITSFTSAMPLIMLIMVLFSPALLIFVTSRKLIYIAWMLVYLLALPVWNFILPVYSYWHFDDFSWGATRMVEGETKGDSHGKAEGEFDSSKVSLKRWEDYERRRRRSVRRRERENQELLADDQSDRLMYGGGEMGGYGTHQFPDAESARSGSLDLGPEQSNYQYGAGAGQAVDRSYSNQMQFSDAEYTYPQTSYPSQGHSSQGHSDDDTDQGGRKPRGPRPMQ